jgi:O-antigen ligase
MTWLSLQIIYSAELSQKKSIRKLIGPIIAFITVTTLLINTSPSIQNRIEHTFFEITTWLKDPLIYTSAGARMSMWVASIQLISENWLGYGEVDIKEISFNHHLYAGIHQHGVKDLIQAGPHSDILSKGLSSGIPGIIAYLLIMFAPLLIFLKKLSSINKDIEKSAKVGLLYITGVFIAGLFNETLSLKYLCTFYGLMIACLMAEVLNNNSATQTKN